ncbi:polysaccharide deacetylase family protein [Fibrobacterota bacterium]
MFRFLLCVFLSGWLAVSASAYTVSGFVVDPDDNPIEGATVYVNSDQGNEVLSESDGSFSLTDVTGAGRAEPVPGPIRLSLRDAVLSFQAPHSSPAILGIYDIKQRLLHTGSWRLSPGNNRYILPALQTSGAYIIKISGKDLSAYTQAYFLNGATWRQDVTLPATGAEEGRGLAKARAGAQDQLTLTARKSGYMNGSADAEDGATDVVIVLSPISGDAPTVTKALWKGDRKCVVTATFDDNHSNQLSGAMPLFQQYGYTCSFYLITNRVSNWGGWLGAHEAGFEIGNHTATHDGTADEADILQGRQDIEDNIGVAPLTFAFPGGSQTSSATAVVRESHIDCRHSSHRAYFDREYPEGDNMSGSAFVSTIDNIRGQPRHWDYANTGALITWLVFYIHDANSSRISALETMLSHISQNDDEVWCTTYRDATLYQQEYDHTDIQITGYSDNSVTFTAIRDFEPIVDWENVTHDYGVDDPSIYNAPLTLIVSTGGSPSQASAERSGGIAPTNVRVRGQDVLVDVVPGDGAVTVTW